MNRTALTLTAIILLSFFPISAQAREDVKEYSIQEAMQSPDAQAKLNDSISFYFGSQHHPGVARRLGEFRTNKKTNALGKSDLRACQWAFLSAMLSLQQRAEREGGNAVINIQSNYKSHRTSSSETFQCGAGNIIAGVALVGEVVKLNK